MQPIIIATDKRKLLLRLLLALALLLTSVALWFVAHSNNDAPLTIVIVSALGIVFTAAATLWMIRRMLDSSPALVLDSEGIHDHSSAVAFETVLWNDILDFRLEQMNRQEFIVVVVSNPDVYIAQKAALQQQAARANYSLCGSPVTISASMLSLSTHELLSTLQQAKASARV